MSLVNICSKSLCFGEDIRKDVFKRKAWVPYCSNKW